MQSAPQRVLLLGTENADGTITGVTATQSSKPVPLDGRGKITVYLRSVGTTSGGTVIIEEADWGPLESIYSGTWTQLLSQAANGFTGGAQLAYHVPPDVEMGYIRVRISSTITGGGAITAVLRDSGS